MGRQNWRTTAIRILAVCSAWGYSASTLADDPRPDLGKSGWRKAGTSRPASSSPATPENRSGSAAEIVRASGISTEIVEPNSNTIGPRLTAIPTDATAARPPQISISNSSVTLEMLEQLARELNPTLAQALAAVEASRGRQVQAGLLPNPTIGYVGSEIGNDGRAGQQGFLIGQEIIRGGKRRLNQAAAGFDRELAEIRAEAQAARVLNSVRTLFHETIAAGRTQELTQELVRLAEQGVTIARQRKQAREGTLTEILQAQIELDRVQVLAASAENQYLAAWQRLAAAAGKPDLPPTPLVDVIDPLSMQRDRVASLERIFQESPELRIAERGIRRAQTLLERARVESVPNLTIEAGTQFDFASRYQIAQAGLSLPLPLFNRNQGNIVAAKSDLVAAQHELDRVKLELTDRFAIAFARYRNTYQQVERYGEKLSDSEIAAILQLKGEELQVQIDRHPQILPRAQMALALATEGWQRGEFDYFHVMTAQRTLVQVGLAHVRATADLRQNVVVLDGLLLADGALTGTGSRDSINSRGQAGPDGE